MCPLWLRRTGKTVMMEQGIAELPEEEKQKKCLPSLFEWLRYARNPPRNGATL